MHKTELPDVVTLQQWAEKIREYCKTRENCHFCYFAEPILFHNIGEIGLYCPMTERPREWRFKK